MATIPTSTRHTSPPRTPKPATAEPDAVCVRAGHLVLPTYLPALPDRNPMFLEKRVYQGSSGKVYPLPFTDRIAEKPVERAWQAIWIENEFLRVLVLPEIGGRIHAIQDKTNGYDLIYNQHVIKPALVGLAGPWISGGIEFNWPQHHRPATFLPVDHEIETHPDGSVTVWCSDHDPMARMKGMHGVCLHPGKAYAELKVRAYNRTSLTQTFLWWANVATRVHEAYQSFFPPDVHYVADHARRSMSEYPLAEGFYYGVSYGERGRKGIPKSEMPSQFIPPHCANVAAGILPAVEPGFQPGGNGVDGSASAKNLEDVAQAATDPGGKMPPSTTGRMPAATYAPNDLSFYANIPVPTSYMCMGSQEDFFGGYDYKAQAGIVHIANHHISPGKKQWTWGNHEFGYAWDRNLTEKDAKSEFGPYIEIMAGVYTDNQPDFSFLQPGETKTWSQYWYPIQQIGPAQHANLDAAISLRWSADHQIGQSQKPTRTEPIRRSALLRLGVSVTKKFSKAIVSVTAKGKTVERFTHNLAPGVPFVAEVLLPTGRQETDLLLRVTDSAGNEIISYQPKPRAKGKVPPPASEPPAPRDIASADELFITGLHLNQYRHATRCATLYWREALRRDPLDARCNNALGLWHLRRGEFTEAEIHFRRAIERLTRRNANPSDGEAHYNLGLCLRYQLDSGARLWSKTQPQHDDNASAVRFGEGAAAGAAHTAALRLFAPAYAAFYKATWNQASAAAGYHALAEIDCTRHDWNAALEHLNRSLRFDTDNLRARDLKVIVLRRLNRASEADALLRETLSLDPLDWWARHLRGDELKCDLQSRLDLAHDFARAGLFAEAIQLLISQIESQRDSGTQPKVAASDGATLSGLQNSSLHTQGSRLSANPGLKDTIPLGLPDQSWGALPLVHYTLGWLEERLAGARLGSETQPQHVHTSKSSGKSGVAAAGAAHTAALHHYRTAAKLPPDYCFPARLEEIAILEAAMAANPGDARAPYYLGNLFYDRRRHAEAIRLWEKAAKLDASFSIVWRNLGIGYFNIHGISAKARAAYDRAFKANSDDARLLYERDQLWKRLGEKPAKRLLELELRLDLAQQRDDLSVELCALYNQTGQPAKALALVTARNFQPWEGGEGGPLGQWVRSHLALGRAALHAVAAGILPAVEPGFQPGGNKRRSSMRSESPEVLAQAGACSGRQDAALHVRQGCLTPQATAVAHFRAALTAPLNLGEAKHLLANQSDIHYWLGCALAANGDAREAKANWLAAATFKGDFQEMSVRAFSEMTYYSALAWEKLGQRAKAKKLFRELLAYAQKLQKAQANIDYFATSLPTMLIFDDDLQRRQETTALFLQAQARFGLGQHTQARKLLVKVLQRDPNHACAADYLGSIQPLVQLSDYR